MSKIILLIAIVAIGFFLFNKSKKNKELAIENVKAGDAFLEENKQNVDVHTTDSGLQYKVLQEGSGDIHPKATDTVKVHYHGTLIDGRIFDSSVDRGEPISFGLNQVIAGWTEGVQLMVVGEKRRFYIPSTLAYGNSSTGMITAGSTLIFDVELLAINP
ncbi:FKBP-type peptidyl-prolyl cis-trans isomerase [Marinomonas algicola]|uniref:FKBP-type peptidyl-prolyl cis-trans isomerase n=1 Tax=Marinomonas algicola TaxID=2773454 RepID=UPI0017480B48|nr:FKBP-type peptidyl-prolyl cis-trans isomerase [Marinomonas algicola]